MASKETSAKKELNPGREAITSPYYKLAYRRLGFDIVSVDVGRGELVVKHPGACVADFDIDYQPKIWFMMGWVASATSFAHSQIIDTKTGRTFLDYAELTKDRLVFIRACEFEFTKAMYDSEIDKRPLIIKVSGGDIGNTSLSSITEMTSTSGEHLLNYTERVITVGMETRKPIPLPDWYRERNYRMHSQKPPTLEKFIRPVGIKHKTMQVHWSNIDFNVHANWATYVLMTINTASLLVKDGYLSHFRSNKLRGLHKLQLQFLSESLEGDELDIYVWEDSQTHIMRSDVCKNGESIFLGSFEFFKD